jgi:DNA-binding GntR family transcriptional regulator
LDNIDLNIHIDRDSNEPLYVQIKRSIIENIETGAWPEHFQLPTYKDLAQHTGVSMITIQQSVGNLVRDGVLYRKRGVGVFTAPRKTVPDAKMLGLLLPIFAIPFSRSSPT